ncbi:MAG: GIY-YIG nuclease family protein [Candidatus Moranbacteria bacterium]|nr:GIY-YIG nuclease family protein [Candidatus Moranbacteria bacterium]
MSMKFGNTKEMVFQKELPDTPGVYFFMEGKSILYIGKATSLRSRVRSYFSHDISSTRGPKIVAMLEKVTDLKWQTTDSVLEALLLEASLIKKHQPPYNTDEKDDKSFYSVVITKEAFPRVLLMRGRDMDAKKDMKIRYTFGPFPQGGSLKEALKIVRKIFPYRDTCKPLSGKPCFNAQLGLCPGVCDGAVTAKDYAKTIRNIKLFFEGKKSMIVRYLKKEMGEYAKRLEFEKAQALKKTLFALSHIYDVSLLRKDAIESYAADSFRIEAYDVAHLSGRDVVGVMTVLESGVPDKKEYRQFKLSIERNNDVKNLEEILMRRLKHSEWRMPDLIVVDGFDLQINVAHAVLEQFAMAIPVVGVVKDEHHNPKSILGEGEFAKKYHDAILLANSEAHRFAITFHRKRRAKSFLLTKGKK